MVTVVCVCLVTGFTVTDNRIKDVKTGANVRTQIAKWKNTTWVNPWLNEKGFNVPKKSLANNFFVINFVTDPDVFQACSLVYPGGGYDLRTTGAFEIPTGQTVTFIGLVDGSKGNIAVQVNDANTSELLYFNAGPSALFQWTPQVGKLYLLTVEYF